MFDEQIRKNAKDYINNLSNEYSHGVINSRTMYSYTDFIAGACSRDKEIEFLMSIIEKLNVELKEKNEIICVLESECRHKGYEIDRLRELIINPWISVEERLPEKSGKHKGWLSDTVFVVTNQGDGTSARYDLATKTWCPAKIL